MLVILPEDNEIPNSHVSAGGKSRDWRKDFHAIEKYQFIHNFLPHRHHRTRARLLSVKALFAYSALILCTFIVLKTIPVFFPGVLGYASNISITDLYTVSNQKREEEGLAKLKLNEALSIAAKEKAEDMFKKGYWAHVAPDGTEPWEFILAEDYDYSYAGENLAKNFNYSKEVVEAWFNSPSHRENLLSANYEEVGYAVVDGVLDGYETTLVVQMFGKKRGTGFLASSYNEKEILESLEVRAPAAAEVAAPPVVEGKAASDFVDVSTIARSLNVVLGGFLISLLGLDIWYSRRHKILKFTGHTLAHLVFLLAAFVGMWIAFMPGKIL